MAQGESKLNEMDSSKRVLSFLFITALLCSQSVLAAPLDAQPVAITPCEAPLLLHLRPPASASETLAPESFELCDESALTELIESLESRGLVYYDDFFELSGNWPEWLKLFAMS